MDSPSGGTFMESIQSDPERIEINFGIFMLRKTFLRLNITLP
jgi:hypothetical protein